MYEKKSFKTFAISLTLVIIFSVSANVIFSLLTGLFESIGFTVFQNFRLSMTFFSFKANHLAYIVPSWYGSRISADCQQKLFFTKHDTGEDFY